MEMYSCHSLFRKRFKNYSSYSPLTFYHLVYGVIASFTSKVDLCRDQYVTIYVHIHVNAIPKTMKLGKQNNFPADLISGSRCLNCVCVCVCVCVCQRKERGEMKETFKYKYPNTLNNQGWEKHPYVFG